MESSLTRISFRRFLRTWVLILILMESSLTIVSNNQVFNVQSLNPYSNGILSDNLKESILDFSCFSSLSFNPFCVRELVPSEKFFANVCEFILHSK